MSTPTHYPYSARIEFPDGTARAFDRWGNSAQFAVVGRDRVGQRRNEPLAVAEWCSCTDPEFARLAAERWSDQFGGEWSVVPVTYTTPGSAYR